MVFNNPWGNRSSAHQRWFNNQWQINSSHLGDSTDAGLKNRVLNWGPSQWRKSGFDKVKSELPFAMQEEPPAEWLRYTVKNDEGFDLIATKFGTSGGGSDLAFWNNMDYSNPNLPQHGDVLALPYITEETLDEIEAALDEKTTDAEEKGWAVAVDNLNRFRTGVGGTKIMDTAWLKSFVSVTDAITDIQELFQGALSEISDEMDDGETINGDGTKKETGNQYWWQGFIDVPYFPPEEISMACGASTLTGIVKIKLVRSDDVVTISGEVEYQFYDPYDWKPGETAPVGFSWGQAAVFPLMGLPIEEWPDSNMILLDEFRGAAEFIMEASWKQKVSGTITVGFWSNEINLTWTDI